MKTCTKCGVEKPLAEFYRLGAGFRAHCKSCTIARSAAWATAHPGAVAARAKAWRQTNAPDPVVTAARGRAWYEENRTKVLVAQKAYREVNSAALAAKKKIWREANPEIHAARGRAWHRNNPQAGAARFARRRAAKLNATPAWANQFFIEEIYDLAQLRTRITGFEWQVDHIVPLQSETVCGLHVEHNLRVIPAVHNLSKGNRHWPDMP